MGERAPAVAIADDAGRIAAALRWYEDVTSSRRIRTPLGTALYHDDFRERYDSNFLRLEGADGTVDAAEVAAGCDRLFDGFAHREVIVEDPRRGAALAPGFGELGWRVDRLVTMSRRGDPDRHVSTDGTEEIDVDGIVAFSGRVHRESSPSLADRVVETLAAFAHVEREHAGARFFSARVDGEIASACSLFLHGGAAEIEDVNTLEAFRGRGLARAIVTRAADEALAAGADLVWLIADDGDWPKEFYAKLGFIRVDTFWQFTLADE